MIRKVPGKVYWRSKLVDPYADPDRIRAVQNWPHEAWLPVIRTREGESEHGVLWKFDVLGDEQVRVFEGGAAVGSILIRGALIQMDDLDLMSTYDSLEAMLDDGWQVAP